MPYTYKAAAQSALDVQDASNLSGVVFSFADVMRAICDRDQDKGTDWKNHHPIVTMYLLKMAELNGCDSTLNPAYDSAAKLCQQIAQGEPEAY